jgi:dipeptidyl aminopeptidase/acylaminoacyl peptidase
LAERVPLVLWIYPTLFADRHYAEQWTNVTAGWADGGTLSLRFLLDEGYALSEAPPLPLVGDSPEEHIRQLVLSAEAIVKCAVDTGAVDPSRIAVGGFSFGASATALLLAHTKLFAAGVAISGSYNRSLTPFGFQAEQRTLWDAWDHYRAASPLWVANQITAPLLLLHGEKDENPGTPALQSELFFNALSGLKRRARYVRLPEEGHVLVTKQGISTALCEISAWLRRHVAPDVTSRSFVENVTRDCSSVAAVKGYL